MTPAEVAAASRALQGLPRITDPAALIRVAALLLTPAGQEEPSDPKQAA